MSKQPLCYNPSISCFFSKSFPTDGEKVDQRTLLAALLGMLGSALRTPSARNRHHCVGGCENRSFDARVPVSPKIS